jgi:hypothetical protein
MKYEILNKTDEDISIGSIIFTAGTTTKIFDSSVELYLPALVIFKEYQNEIGILISKGDLVFHIDGEAKIPADFFLLVTDWKKSLAGFPISYLETPGQNAYFHLTENRLKIRNPISGKWYEVQLVEVAE